jgi:hypothetical protein
VLGLPIVEKLSQGLGPEFGCRCVRQPAGETTSTSLGGGPNGITEVGIERDTQLVDLHVFILPR